MPKRAVIIVAGGTGTRMKSTTAKQFLPLSGKPILIHTFEAFYRFDPEMQFILVLYPALKPEWEEIVKANNFQIEHKVVDGGAERFHSVRNGLEALSPDVEIVAIHDAVRPLISQATIERCMESAQKYGGAISTVPVIDSIRQIDGDSSHSLPRNQLVAVQTPQCFRVENIKSAYRSNYDNAFTDDASVATSAGFPVKLVAGNRANLKITTQEDLTIAVALLESGLQG